MAASPIPMRAEPQPMRPEPFDKFRTWAATFDPGPVYEMASAIGRNVAAVHPPGFVASERRGLGLLLGGVEEGSTRMIQGERVMDAPRPSSATRANAH